MSRILLVSSVLAVALVAGPGRSARVANADSGGTGTIRGIVELKGVPPKRKPLERDSDPICAKSPKLSEDVVVTNGRLRDVHVRIEVGAAGKHKAPTKPAVVNQVECMYTPRVIGIVEGQQVAIHNSDPTYHNVRGAKHERTIWNLGQPPSGPALIRENLGKAGEVVSLHCDIHSWMRAYAVITDHPFFDVTDAKGAFTIEDVPVGTYTLEAWHPELGLKRTKITVRKDKTTTAVFTY